MYSKYAIPVSDALDHIHNEYRGEFLNPHDIDKILDSISSVLKGGEKSNRSRVQGIGKILNPFGARSSVI